MKNLSSKVFVSFLTLLISNISQAGSGEICTDLDNIVAGVAVPITFLVTGTVSCSAVSNSGVFATNGNLSATNNINAGGNLTVGSGGGATTNSIAATDSTSISAGTNSVSVTSGTSGANAAITINGVVSGTNTSKTGVLITGAGLVGNPTPQEIASYKANPSTVDWADVSIQSQNYGEGDPSIGSAIRVTDYGVQIITPTTTAGQIVNNTFGQNTGLGTTINNIGGGSGATTNNIGNTNQNTVVATTAANSTTNLGNGYSTTNVSAGTGTGDSIIRGATFGTNGQSGIALKGADASHVVVDSNGKITTSSGNVEQTTASMTVTNGLNKTHGFMVNEQQATMSGGTQSSSLTLNDHGATFSNSANGRPIKVHGVADGTSDYDAVNVQQLNAVKLGVAGVAAMNGIPALSSDKQFNLGIGAGGFGGKEAVAIGGNARITENLVIKGALSTDLMSSNASNINTTTWSIGGALSW